MLRVHLYGTRHAPVSVSASNLNAICSTPETKTDIVTFHVCFTRSLRIKSGFFSILRHTHDQFKHKSLVYPIYYSELTFSICDCPPPPPQKTPQNIRLYLPQPSSLTTLHLLHLWTQLPIHSTVVRHYLRQKYNMNISHYLFISHFTCFEVTKAFIDTNVHRGLRNTYLIQVLCLILDFKSFT